MPTLLILFQVLLDLAAPSHRRVGKLLDILSPIVLGVVLIYQH